MFHRRKVLIENTTHPITKDASEETYLHNGNVLYAQKQYEAAILEYDKAINLSPTLVEAYYKRGNAKVELRQYFEAISDFDKVIRIAPEFENVYNARGISKVELGHPEDAKRDFKTALDLAEKKGDEKLMAQIKPMLS